MTIYCYKLKSVTPRTIRHEIFQIRRIKSNTLNIYVTNLQNHPRYILVYTRTVAFTQNYTQLRVYLQVLNETCQSVLLSLHRHYINVENDIIRNAFDKITYRERPSNFNKVGEKGNELGRNT